MLRVTKFANPSWLFALPVLFCLATCRPRRPTLAPGANSPGVTAHCTSGAVQREGPYAFENNQWGAHKAQGAFEQCLLERTRQGRAERGWSWSWPGTDPSVFAYPEIVFGWEPWSGGRSTDARFPLRVSDVQHLSVRYAVETEASGSYNLAPEVWLIRRRSSAGAANARLISTEIMFWLEAAGGAQPSGTIVDRPVVDGVQYDLSLQDGAAGDGSAGTWRLIFLKTPNTRRAGTIPVDELLRYLAQKQLIDPTHYVASVELGNEISGGQGVTWVKDFAVEVSP